MRKLIISAIMGAMIMSEVMAQGTITTGSTLTLAPIGAMSALTIAPTLTSAMVFNTKSGPVKLRFGEELSVEGNGSMDEAAAKFIELLSTQWRTELMRLREENAALRREL